MKRVHVVIVTDTGDYLSNKILGNDSKIILKMGYDLGFQTSIGMAVYASNSGSL